MEPSGRNRWQPVANEQAPKTPKTSQNLAMGCDPLPLNLDGKGAPPLGKGGGRLSGSAENAKSCEPEGPQDLTRRL
jgi:hypothetical protein